MIFKSEHRGKGIAIGKAFIHIRHKNGGNTPCLGDAIVAKSDKSEEDTAAQGEIAFKSALDALIQELQQQTSCSDVPSAGIFEAQMEMANDPLLEETTLGHISEGMSAASAVSQAGEEIAEMLSGIDDEYLKSRADDVRDICSRLKDIIEGNKVHNPFEDINEGTIIIADELLPSDTALIDFSKVVALVTSSGSPTSHVCIIAANKGIPAIVGVSGIPQGITEGETVIADADNGLVITSPEEETLDKYMSLAGQISREQTILKEKASLPAVTLDGIRIKVYANAGNLEEIKDAVSLGAEGIGLFRTEFLYLRGEHLPTEDELTSTFSEALDILNGRPLTIRALDIGGDKQIPNIEMPFEDNPFLGCRGIRFLLTHTDLFKTQIRAVLRAASKGKIRFMLPMVCTTDEIVKAENLIAICKEELSLEGREQGEISLGIMVETPAAVFTAGKLGDRVDFFSIGTNDLTQYVMAADRGNSSVSHLLDSSNDAVTSAIRMIITAGEKAETEVGMCGEYAASSDSTETLIRLGLREFSVSPAAIPALKQRIRNLKY